MKKTWAQRLSLMLLRLAISINPLLIQRIHNDHGFPSDRVIYIAGNLPVPRMIPRNNNQNALISRRVFFYFNTPM